MSFWGRRAPNRATTRAIHILACPPRHVYTTSRQRSLWLLARLACCNSAGRPRGCLLPIGPLRRTPCVGRNFWGRDNPWAAVTHGTAASHATEAAATYVQDRRDRRKPLDRGSSWARGTQAGRCHPRDRRGDPWPPRFMGSAATHAPRESMGSPRGRGEVRGPSDKQESPKPKCVGLAQYVSRAGVGLAELGFRRFLSRRVRMGLDRLGPILPPVIRPNPGSLRGRLWGTATGRLARVRRRGGRPSFTAAAARPARRIRAKESGVHEGCEESGREDPRQGRGEVEGGRARARRFGWLGGDASLGAGGLCVVGAGALGSGAGRGVFFLLRGGVGWGGGCWGWWRLGGAGGEKAG